MPDLIISEESAKVIDDIISRAKSTKYGQITNWGTPYGISFDELVLIGDRMKYGDEFVNERSRREALKRIEECEKKSSISKITTSVR